VANQSGTVDIVIIASDAAGLASSSAFVLTVTDINDAPVMSSISPQTTDEDIAIDSIAFTATDLETAACGLNITFISSDPTLISDTNLSYSCDADQYTITAIPQTNQNGVATITVIVADSGGLTTSTSFDLTVTSVNDAPVVSLANPDNLLVNPGAETGDTSGWTITENGGSGWSNRGDYSHDGSLYGFITSYGWCRKNQLIDLIAEGYSAAELDLQPTVYIEEWARARSSDDPYQMKVELRDASQQVIDSFDTGVLSVNSTWELYSNTFEFYGTGLRYIYFEHGGRDSEGWSGNYGSVMDDAVVRIETSTTIAEDNVLQLDLSLSDIEGDSLTLTAISSTNTTLVPLSNITFSGTGATRTINITPTTNESGNVTITVAVFDGNLTSTTAFALTVLSVNDSPQIGTIVDQTTMEDIATSVISFTVADNETAGCSMTLTMTSSDPTLVPDEYLLSICSGNAYSIVATPAMDQYGTATISVTIADAGGLMASTSFTLTVTDVDDNIYMWTNNQAANVVIGQSDFNTNSSGTSSTKLTHGTAASVDLATGKLFISDRLNHRILRFSSTDAAINGAAAEAVLGQADFNSGAANRGGSVAANTLNGPNDLVVDSFGRLWVADYLNNRVLRFDNASSIASGANADAVLGQTDFTTSSSDTTQNKFNKPTGIHIDPSGTLWVAEMSNHRILRFDNAASKTNGANADGVLGQVDFTSNTTGTTQNTMNGSFDVFGDHDDHIYVLDLNNNRVLRFDNASLKSNGANADAVLGQTDFVSSSNGTTQRNFNSPLAGTVDPFNNLYISDMSNNRVMIFNNPLIKANGAPADYVLGQPNFMESTANNGGVSGRSLSEPHWLFFDNINKYLWLPDGTNYRVLRYTMLLKTPPVMSQISDDTFDEDTVSNSLSFTVTDINEQALTITYVSSDTSLVSAIGITFTGNQVSTDGITYTVTTTATATTVTLNIRPESDQSGTASITITVTDPDGMADTQSFRLTITNVNDAPYVANPIADRIATEGNAYAYTVPSNTFTDIDPGDILTYTATQYDGSALPGWLSFDPATGEFTGLPTNSDVGSITITVTATDSSAEYITDTFVLSVNNTNSSPVLDYPIADQTAIQDVAYSFTFAANTFSDDDVAYGDTISYTAMQADGSPLPFWLTFDIYNRNFSGTPTNNDVGMYTITVIAEDTLNLTAMDSFYLTVVNINDAPEISDIYRSSAVISGLTINEDSPVDDLSFTIYDMDVEDTNLTVSLESSNTSLVPVSNMSYSCTYGSCIMSLTPVANENGTAIITVIVTDPQGLTASNAFDLTVTAVNDTPIISSISNQTIIEDQVLDSITFTASDIETSDCSFTLSVNSSYTQLIPIESITYTCSSGTYHLSITPAEDQSGSTTITIAVSDSGNLSVSESFDITVVPAGPGNVDLADGSGDLKVWFKADTLSSLNDGDSVTTWSDSSGNNNDAAQSNASYRPVYRSAAFNNQPAVEFDGVSLHCLTGTASQAFSAPATIIFVAKDMGSTDLVAGVFSSGSGGIGIFSNAGLEYVLDGNGAGRDTSSNTQMPINTSRIITGYYSQNSTSGSKIYLSGLYEENYTGSGFSTPGSTSFEIGGRTPSDPNRIFKGQIAEVAVYSRELTPVAQTHIELYLMDKYDIDLVGSALDADLLKNARGISKQSEVTISGSSAGLTIADAGFLQDNDDILIIGHTELLNQEISDDLPTGPTLRWSRTWKVIVNDSNSDGGAIQMIFGFNSAGMQTSPSSADAYSLLYRSGVSGSFSLVGTTSQSIDGNAVIFNVPNIQNGYYTIGSTDSRTQNEAPVASFAQALQLDGTDDYVVIPHSDILKPSTITVEAWIRADSWATNMHENVIVGSGDNEIGAEGYTLRCGANGTLDFALGSNSSWQNASSPASMQAGVWTHVAGTFDGTTIKTYINGVLEGSLDISGSAINYLTKTPLQIGEEPGYPGRFFHGLIDEVRVWNYARTSQELQSTMNEILNGDETGLVQRNLEMPYRLDNETKHHQIQLLADY
jgi:hypothetical protein